MQKVCSVINLFAYYAIGLPSAVTFAFILKIGGKVGSTMFYFYVIMIRYILICVPFMCDGSANICFGCDDASNQLE